MASGARVDAADQWRVGEDKRLIFTVYDDQGVKLNPDGWTATYRIFARRARPGDAPLASITGLVGAGGVITVDVPAASTADLMAGTYEHVLRRVDEGNKAVLAYDSIELGAAP